MLTFTILQGTAPKRKQNVVGRLRNRNFTALGIGAYSHAGNIALSRVQYAPSSERTSAAIGDAAYLPARWTAVSRGDCQSGQLDAIKSKKTAGGRS